MISSDYSSTFVNGALGWLRAFANWIVNLFNLSAGMENGGFIGWFAANWLKLLIILILVGVLVDWIVWLIRWRPYWLWFRKKRIVLDDDVLKAERQRQKKKASSAKNARKKAVRSKWDEEFLDELLSDEESIDASGTTSNGAHDGTEEYDIPSEVPARRGKEKRRSAVVPLKARPSQAEAKFHREAEDAEFWADEPSAGVQKKPKKAVRKAPVNQQTDEFDMFMADEKPAKQPKTRVKPEAETAETGLNFEDEPVKPKKSHRGPLFKLVEKDEEPAKRDAAMPEKAHDRNPHRRPHKEKDVFGDDPFDISTEDPDAVTFWQDDVFKVSDLADDDDMDDAFGKKNRKTGKGKR